MTERPPEAAAAAAAAKTMLQKPPGYRDAMATNGGAATRPPMVPRKPPQLPPTLRHPGKPPARRRPRRSCCCRTCFWVTLILLALVVVLAVACFLAYLWFQPRLPSYRIESIRVSRFNVSSRSDGSSYLDAAAAVAVQAANHNGKMELSYADLEAWVSVADDDGDVTIGSSGASGFVQGKRNSTVVRFSANVKGMMVDEAVGRRMAVRFKSKELRFGLELRTRVAARVSGKRTRRVPIRVVCGAVSLKQVATAGGGGHGGVLPNCSIYLFRWIKLH
ncbi:hypothetical protein J5N97_028083 [Dioscorea zingiberensis]|uniref:Late embryogenesis abundant protein LEA-2 subgroup domain-containing protein n=1 Tax=Dioscorea zingiberensis TaxID=325984 RepID=A0A9D5BY05_9LILI|nr:hypothetical protein J5N97_028083 [Dioscorea zingiberensis]